MISTLAQIAMILAVAAPLQTTAQPATQAQAAELQTKFEAHDNKPRDGDSTGATITGGLIAGIIGIVTILLAATINHLFQNSRESRQRTADLIRERRTLICNLSSTCKAMVGLAAQSSHYGAEIHLRHHLLRDILINKAPPHKPRRDNDKRIRRRTPQTTG